MSRSTDKYHFFWKSKLSQWNMTYFVIGKGCCKMTCTCAEQWMMYAKAMLFNDKETAIKIMQAVHPREMQELGRQVKGYDQKIWDENKYQIVVEGNYAKFSQNTELKSRLLKTHPLTLVEASPVDCVWGVGLAEDNPLIDDELNWKGQNLLGKALTEVREMILGEN